MSSSITGTHTEDCVVNITHIPAAEGGFVDTGDMDILPRGFKIIEVVLYPIVSKETALCLLFSY